MKEMKIQVGNIFLILMTMIINIINVYLFMCIKFKGYLYLIKYFIEINGFIL